MAAKNTESKAPSFSAEERAAMKERAKELKDAAKGQDALDAQLDAIKKFPKGDREIAERIQALVTETAPQLQSKTYYGMPAYFNADGKVICFFQPASKFGARYGTLGFENTAKLDDGDMWPTSFAVMKLTPAVEKRIVELVTKAVG